MLISKFFGGTARGEMTFSNGLVVGPQIRWRYYCFFLGSTDRWLTIHGDWVWAKMAGSDTDDDDRTGDICPDGFGNVYALVFLKI